MGENRLQCTFSGMVRPPYFSVVVFWKVFWVFYRGYWQLLGFDPQPCALWFWSFHVWSWLFACNMPPDNSGHWVSGRFSAKAICPSLQSNLKQVSGCCLAPPNKAVPGVHVTWFVAILIFKLWVLLKMLVTTRCLQKAPQTCNLLQKRTKNKQQRHKQSKY